MKQEEIEKLLGRDLTTEEVANLDLYLDIASEKLNSLLCCKVSCPGVFEERRFEAREGYSTVFMDIFTDVETVKVDGVESDAEDYEVRQMDNLNGSWYNSLVFDKRHRKDSIVTVEASWGFDSMPKDLKLLWARLFDLTGTENGTNGRVRSQRIDDAQVTFSDGTVEEQFYKDNRSIIQRYSLCTVGNIKHGKVRYHGRI